MAKKKSVSPKIRSAAETETAPAPKRSRSKKSTDTVTTDETALPKNATPQPHVVLDIDIQRATKQKGPVATIVTTQVQPDGKPKEKTFTREYPHGTAMEQITTEIGTSKFLNDLWKEGKGK